MKKKKLFFLLLTLLSSTGLNNNSYLSTPFSMRPKYVYDLPDIRPGGGAPKLYKSDYDAKNAPDIKYQGYYNGISDDTFGTPKLINDATQYDEESKKTYRSNWTNSDSYKTYKTKIFETYKFSKLVDIPIKTLITRKLNGGENITAKIQATESTSQQTTITTEFASSYYGERSAEYGINIGIKLPIDKLKLSENFSYNENYKIGGSVSTKIAKTKTSTTTFSSLYEETVEMDNSNSSTPTYFAFNFRQKFELYFTTAFSYVYNESTWNSGLFNWDVHYEFEFDHYEGIGTVFYLLPIETPYFEISKYQDNSYGHQKIVKEDANENIVYL